jgi:hypothetical protein
VKCLKKNGAGFNINILTITFSSSEYKFIIGQSMKYNIAAKGILEQDSKILFIEYEDTKGNILFSARWHTRYRRIFANTVVREFKEETCLDIK